MNSHVFPGRGPGASELGLNSWLVEEKYQEYLADPASVEADWRDYFSVPAANGNGNGSANGASAPATAPAATAAPAASLPAATAAPDAPATGATAAAVLPPPSAGQAPTPTAPAAGADEASPLRGTAARLVENMEKSLGVPTATSVHPLPAKFLEANRRQLNEHLGRTGQGKVSFTHLIGWAVVKGLGEVPALNASFVADTDGKGTPGVVRHRHVGLGIAIDLERAGGRSLVVPAVRDADTLGFSGFVAAYEELVRRARGQKLTPEDFAGVTVTITNPGTLGTTQSVPRLMAGQGAIIGIGALDFPVEYRAADAETLAALGVSKVLTLTSTYDHRIIQGAESGLFLKYVDELLVGDHGFYEEIFSDVGLAEPPARLGSSHSDVATLNRAGPDADKELAVAALIAAYRRRGHLAASLDPLADRPPVVPADLDPASYGLSAFDLDRSFHTGGIPGRDRAPLSWVLDRLRDAYCRTIGVEYDHVDDPEERRFLEVLFETPRPAPAPDVKLHLLERLTAAETFERFLQARYVGQKRFGLEGGEAAIVFLDTVLEEAARSGVSEAVLGMAHRGRLNALANIVGKSFAEILAEFEDTLDPRTVQGSGDVKYHKGGAGKWVGHDGATVGVVMASNPSHLEAVDPVVEGIARAKQDQKEGGESSVLAILAHGDASFAAQGVVAETLNLSLVDAYRVGGTVHLLINNQIGFTTPTGSARSTRYATDVAKGVGAPVLHVNGDDPEAVADVARMAVAYRMAFRKDVVVDLVCYRRRGHNEGDDPSYTQPLMYKVIDAHKSVRDLYAERLVEAGLLTAEEAEHGVAEFNARMQSALVETRDHAAAPIAALPERTRPELPGLEMATGVDRATLDAIEAVLAATPAGFTVHPKLVRQLTQRDEHYREGEVEWALAEALALGSLLLEGTDVRLTGQDTRRGTFSHRHAVLVDAESGAEHTPLSAVAEALASGSPAGRFFIADSVLSEYAALGFEYGYSVEDRDGLVLWEAQFGDFANGAQIVIDNFVVAAEEKWGQSSGLVLLLPHGYEGQGPEHSSARLERYLTLAANGNITVAQPTTAAQYFHLLRAQAHRTLRRPLVVVAPKSLLRARPARSPLDALTTGGFAPVLDDPALAADPGEVGRVVFCSGKIAFEAIERRDALAGSDGAARATAVVRLEQLYPFPAVELAAVLGRYPAAREVLWLQDEPANMGAWTFVRERFEKVLPGGSMLVRVSREAAGSPATGSHILHELERQHLLDLAVGAERAS